MTLLMYSSPWNALFYLICSMLKVDVRDCYKYMPSDGSTSEAEDRDKEELEKNKFYIKLR